MTDEWDSPVEPSVQVLRPSNPAYYEYIEDTEEIRFAAFLYSFGGFTKYCYDYTLSEQYNHDRLFIMGSKNFFTGHWDPTTEKVIVESYDETKKCDDEETYASFRVYLTAPKGLLEGEEIKLDFCLTQLNTIQDDTEIQICSMNEVLFLHRFKGLTSFSVSIEQFTGAYYVVLRPVFIKDQIALNYVKVSSWV